MAIFEGSVQEFHDYIGPRFRNLIQNLTRKGRKAGVCEDCGKTEQKLQSAHLHGRDRPSIIETILSRHETNRIVKCKIDVVEKEFLKEHRPIEDALKFLCHDCHRRYHKSEPKEKVAQVIRPSFDGTASTTPVAIDGKRVELTFHPEDEYLFKSQLIKNRRGYYRLYKNDGTVEGEWNVHLFMEKSNLRNNIFSGYLREWKQKGIVKAIFAINKSDLPK